MREGSGGTSFHFNVETFEFLYLFVSSSVPPGIKFKSINLKVNYLVIEVSQSS